MKLSELIFRAACLRRSEAQTVKVRVDKLAKKRSGGRTRKVRVNGLVSIPNCIRKRFGSAPR